jgi:hypothetical protein
MGVTTRGFHGRETKSPHKLPPGQYETQGFPVLSAGPIPRMQLDHWQFTIAPEQGRSHSWSWPQLVGSAAAGAFSVALGVDASVIDIVCGECGYRAPFAEERAYLGRSGNHSVLPTLCQRHRPPGDDARRHVAEFVRVGVLAVADIRRIVTPN